MKTKIFVSLVFVLLAVLTVIGVAGAEYDPCGHFLRWTLPGFNSEPLYWFGSDPATNLTIKDSYEAEGRYFLVGLDDVWVTGVAQSNIWGCYVSELTQEQVDTMVAEGNYPECLIVDGEGNIQSIDLTSGAKCLLPEMPTPPPTATPEPTTTVVPTETPTVEPTPIPSRITLEGGINRADGGWVPAKEGDSLDVTTSFPFDLAPAVYSNLANDIVHFEIASDPAKVPFVPEGKGVIIGTPEWDNGIWYLTVRANSGLAEVVISQIEPPFLPGKTYTVSVYGDGEEIKHSWSAKVSNGKTVFFLFLPLILR